MVELMFDEFILFKHLAKNWQISRSAKRLIIVDGFSFTNHGQFD